MNLITINITQWIKKSAFLMVFAGLALAFQSCNEADPLSTTVDSSAPNPKAVADTSSSADSTIVEGDSSATDTAVANQRGVFGWYKGKLSPQNGRGGSLLFEISRNRQVKGRLKTADTTLAITGKVFIKGDVTTSAHSIILPKNRVGIKFESRDRSYQFNGEFQWRKADIYAVGEWSYCPPCVYEQPRCMIACIGNVKWKAVKVKR